MTISNTLDINAYSLAHLFGIDCWTKHKQYKQLA